MGSIDRHSKSPIRAHEDSSEDQFSANKSYNSSGGSMNSNKKRKMRANYLIVKRKLKDLAAQFLNARIQDGHHSSIIDSRAALAIYRMHYEEIEIKFRCKEALQEVSKNLGPDLCNFKATKASLKKEESKGSFVKPIEDIKYLMKAKKHIFNVTPPNKKDEKKQALLAAKRQREKDSIHSSPNAPPSILTTINESHLEAVSQQFARVNLDAFSQSWNFKDDPISKFDINQI